MSRTLDEFLAGWPRQRPPLSAAHEAIYAAEYKANREGTHAVNSVATRLEAWMHRRIAAAAAPEKSVLELGAGTLNHLRFEPDSTAYDAVEPMELLWRDSPARSRVRTIFPSIDSVPADARYDRVLSVAVLEHLTDLPREVARAVLRMAPDGLFQAGIPSEGGFLWGLAWRSTTGVAYRRRTGLDYRVLMRHEHVNRADEIVRLLRHLFEEVRIARFPTPLHHFSFYACLDARGPRRDRAEALLA